MDVKTVSFNAHWLRAYNNPTFLTFFASAIAKHVARHSELLTNHSAIWWQRPRLMLLEELCTSSIGICLAAVGSQTNSTKNSDECWQWRQLEAVGLCERIRRFLLLLPISLANTVFHLAWSDLPCNAPIYAGPILPVSPLSLFGLTRSRHVMTNPSSLRFPHGPSKRRESLPKILFPPNVYT